LTFDEEFIWRWTFNAIVGDKGPGLQHLMLGHWVKRNGSLEDAQWLSVDVVKERIMAPLDSRFLRTYAGDEDVLQMHERCVNSLFIQPLNHIYGKQIAGSG